MTIDVPVAAGLKLVAPQANGLASNTFIERNHQQRSQVKSEELPIRVRIVRTPEQLQRVCELRSLAYGLRNPALGELLSKPESVDFDPGTVVLLAECKATGEVVGSIRIHTNLFAPIPMQTIIDLPEKFNHLMLAELCRFCVSKSYGWPLVRMAIFKATYLYCYANQVQYTMCVARSPLNELYKTLGFVPLHDGPEDLWMPVSYVGNLEHSLLYIDVVLGEKSWRETKQPYYDFLGRTYHPDIQIFSAASSAWTTPRSQDRR